MSALSRKLSKRLGSITSGLAAVESSENESTYVAKPRYHQKRKSRTLVRWFTYITSDLQRLTGFTLIVVLVCGLGTVALLNLLGPRAVQPVLINEAEAPDDPSLNPQSDLQSSTQDQQIPSPSETSDASAERSFLEQKLDEDGPQVDHSEQSSRLPLFKPVTKSSHTADTPHQKVAKSFDKSDRQHQKEVAPRKQGNQVGSGPTVSVKSARVSEKSVSSTNVVRAEKGDASRAKAVPSKLATKPSSTQRPRRVAGKTDRAVPVATSEKNGKAKVIQWP